jgi:hypothetical protein
MTQGLRFLSRRPQPNSGRGRGFRTRRLGAQAGP